LTLKPDPCKSKGPAPENSKRVEGLATLPERGTLHGHPRQFHPSNVRGLQGETFLTSSFVEPAPIIGFMLA